MRALFTTLFLLLPVHAVASAFEPVDRIIAAAVAAVAPDAARNPDVRAEASLDPGLRMPACPEGLSAHVGSRGVAEVACSGASGWRLFVPVRVTRLEPVLVLMRPVAAGQTITPDLLEVDKRNTSTLSGQALAVPEQAVGQMAARGLMAGSILVSGDLRSPRLVRRGDRVTLVARSGGLEVRSQGRALGDAGLAEQVSVENLGTRRQVRGRVNARGEVEVLL
ncbi:MAG: flagellar basal body P-ring formation protein FlgA [Aquimonas sp.]|nr:flagellar basal body P-ring formation protein FlgA [Aquimonas sp.]